jgi:predicted O-methyltransferase YrrM
MLGIRRAMTEAFRRRAGIDKWVERALEMPVGQVSLTEARFLGDIVRSLSESGPIVEIGTLFGWSTKVIVLHKESNRDLITVDGFYWNPLGLSPQDHFRVTAGILEEAIRAHNVQLIRADKTTFYSSYSGPPPALVFLDADHSYEETVADIAWARRADAKLICLHDYRTDFPGVVRAVDEAGGPKDQVESLVVLR